MSELQEAATQNSCPTCGNSLNNGLCNQCGYGVQINYQEQAEAQQKTDLSTPSENITAIENQVPINEDNNTTREYAKFFNEKKPAIQQPVFQYGYNYSYGSGYQDFRMQNKQQYNPQYAYPQQTYQYNQQPQQPSQPYQPQVNQYSYQAQAQQYQNPPVNPYYPQPQYQPIQPQQTYQNTAYGYSYPQQTQPPIPQQPSVNQYQYQYPNSQMQYPQQNQPVNQSLQYDTQAIQVGNMNNGNQQVKKKKWPLWITISSVALILFVLVVAGGIKLVGMVKDGDPIINKYDFKNDTSSNSKYHYSNGISANELKQIKEGMSYAHVSKIIGGDGTLTDNGITPLDEQYYTYVWIGENKANTYVYITFMNDAVSEIVSDGV